ncbi:MAG: cellulase family glycosylhydrolase, partial [Alistipes sp.]
YVDDPAIMSWQIGNEPRAFGEENKVSYALWIHEVANLIRELDPNHLISTGSEGYQGTEGDIQLWELIHSYANVDYMTIHIWPYNWGWIQKDSIVEKLPQAIANTRAYIDEHLAVARRHNRPVVLEEFGMPRDGFRFDKATSTASRDNYFEAVFAYLAENRARGGLFSGCNFWAWGGFATVANDHTQWQKGDDYTGDPAQEEQGLNSVFASDTTTLRIINRYTELLKKP